MTTLADEGKSESRAAFKKERTQEMKNEHKNEG